MPTEEGVPTPHPLPWGEERGEGRSPLPSQHHPQSEVQHHLVCAAGRWQPWCLVGWGGEG